MHHRPRRRPGRLALLATATITAAAVSGAAVPALAAGQAPARAATPGNQARPVFLINGDRLIVRPVPGGQDAAALLPVPGASSVLSLRLGAKTEDIPADALPYLGRGLDPSLFDVAALQRAESDGRLPVQVRFAGRRPALPGVIITRTGAGSARGYLTASSAKVFGVALQRQFRADHARGSYGSDGLFAGVSIALAGAPTPVRASPDFPMHTLTVTGTNLRGQPDTGDTVIVINAADWQRFGDPNEIFNFFYHGTAKYSLPAGQYWAIGDFVNFRGRHGSERLDVLPQFTVTGNHTRVHLAERAASSRLSFTTSRPTQPELVGITFIRGGLHHTSFGFGFSDSGLSLWVSPTTSKPTVGTLRTFTSAQLASPPTAPGTPYFYNLDYAGPDGIIPPQHYVVSAASLATVHERYFQDRPSTGGWLVFGGFPLQLEGILISLVPPLHLPGLQTQYFTAGPSLAWSLGYVEFYDSFTGGQFDTYRTLPAGKQLTDDWNEYPLHPQPAVQPLHGSLGRILPSVPSAFRSGNRLELDLTPFSDNQPGHLGSGYFPGTGKYAIFANGVRIAHGNPATGIKPVRLSGKPSVIRFVQTADRSSPDFELSSASTTAWTWRSAPQPKAMVPPSWYCGYRLVANRVILLRRCAVQPLLTLRYQVHKLALDGIAPPGPQVIGLAVGHLQLAKRSQITGARAQVSYDNGRFWLPAHIAATGHGQFRILFHAPPGVDVSLRVSATDAAGGSITETILSAYGVGL
jgi:hypothetical protein